MSALVNLEQFRAPVQAWKDKVLLPLSYSDHDAERHAEADRLLSIIDSAGKAEEIKGWRVVQIGSAGSLYDPQGACRAYTYEHQPGNQLAWKLGRATSVASRDSAGDYIDRGLALLNRLQEEGFGVFQVAPIEDAAHQPAPVVDDAMVDAAIAAQDAHWANDDNYPARAPRSVKGDARLHDKLARGAMRAALTAALARAQGVQS